MKKCGDIVDTSGIYGVFSLKNNQKINETTCVKNERFPPTKEKGMYYKIVRKTK